MNWRPHTEHPQAAPVSVMIAFRDDDGGFFLAGSLYYWDGQEFAHETSDLPPRMNEFWWATEEEALQGLTE